MTLYHYTAIELLDAILREGLTRGEIPITERDVENGVWFTTDPSPAGHGLTDGGPISPEERAEIERANGRTYEAIQRLDKRRVRIAVAIPSHDLKLKKWLPYARSRLKADWLAALTQAGGGQEKAETWRLYLGTVPPSRFKAIDVRGEDRVFRPITDTDREEAARSAITRGGEVEIGP